LTSSTRGTEVLAHETAVISFYDLVLLQHFLGLSPEIKRLPNLRMVVFTDS